jgi:PAS domain S-box-containing protein
MAQSAPVLHGRQDMLPLLRRSIWLGSIGLLAVAVTFAGLDMAHRERANWVQHGRELARIARNTRSLATERFSGVRALIAENDLASLGPEVAANRALYPLLDTLVTLTADNPAQQTRARAIRTTLEAWDRGYGAPALREAVRRSRGEPPTHLADINGNALFEPVRMAFDAFLAAEESLYRDRVRKVERFEIVALVAVLIELFLLGTVLVILWRRALRQATLVVEQQEMLEERAVEMEMQAADLEEQTVELEEQTQHANAIARELERANEELSYAINESRDAGQALQAQQLFLRQVIDTMPNFVFAKNRQGRFTLVNEAVAAAYGTTPDALIGKSDADFNSNAEEVAAFLRDDLAVMDTQTKLHIAEEPVTDASGSVRWLQTVKRALVDGGGQAHQVLGVSTDITARKRAENELQREREFLRNALESLTDGIIACDADGTITVFNRAVREMHGLPEGPVPPDSWKDHFALFESDGTTPVTLARYPLARALGGESIDQVEIVVKAMNADPRTVLCSGQAVLGEHGEKIGAVLAMHDVTHRRQLEGQLLQAQRMEAVGRLAGGIAHDFNNMLTAVISYSDLLLREFEPGDTRHEDITEISKAAHRAAALTRQLLVFSRQQVVQPWVLDLNESVAELEKMLARLIGADIALTTVLAPDLGRAKADPGQIEQIVMNLVVNARDAMPDGGKLTIETANVELDESYANAHAFATAGHYVMLSVSDTGFGMSRATREHIFEPFFTTKEPGKGTGLGLSTVYGIVRQAGGNIWVYSELDVGTTFKIYLPRVDAAVSGRVEAKALDPVRRGSEIVLLVEDDEAVRGVACRILRRQGYRVIEATNGIEALDICADPSVEIDAIITDMVMPELGGREFACRLHDYRPGARLIFMSGYTEDAVTRQSLLEPGASFIEKPFTPDALTRKLRAVLDAPARLNGANGNGKNGVATGNGAKV